MAVLRGLKFALLVVFLFEGVCSWRLDPVSYYQRNNDGSYKYEYDAGGGLSARQSGNAANEVEGQYAQLLPDGKLVNVRYKAGVGGFQPQSNAASNGAFPATTPGGAASRRPYSFAYNAGDSSHQAVADQGGNVRGNYWYRDQAGEHDLHYAAGPGVGFVPTGGSLATPNGLGGHSRVPSQVTTQPRWNGPPSNVRYSGPQPDGSYSFSYNNDDSSRLERADPNGGVQGSYSFSNDAGTHDLAYVAGPKTGFQPTGGSLATPNGLGNRGPVSLSSDVPSQSTPPSSVQHTGPNSDGSYSFAYQTPDSARQEAADSRGTVQGSYSFRNEGGRHDLSFVAGPETGFQPTGGSLATPNGQGQRGPSSQVSSGVPSSSNNQNSGPYPDGSYEFSYQNDDSARQETADGRAGVRGANSFQNKAGRNDLSYVAGPTTGFQPTGGSLLRPNSDTPQTPSSPVRKNPSGLQASGPNQYPQKNGNSASNGQTNKNGNVAGSNLFQNEAGNPAGDNAKPGLTEVNFPSSNRPWQFGSDASAVQAQPSYTNNNQANSRQTEEGSGDGSYNFQYSIPNASRRESADAQGNVDGEYSYLDESGQHNLQYKAGNNSGFQVTGGNLATPSPWIRASGDHGGSGDDERGTGDRSYNFGYTNENGSRSESSDAGGNVVGSYGYRNEAGNHDLSYEAGPRKGFVVTGGSLATPNGLSGNPSGDLSVQPLQVKNSGRRNDGSYDFSYDTGKQAHKESGDGAGTVNGKYSYTSNGEQHDLSYRSRPNTGFEVIGGSLAAKGSSS